MYSQADNQEMVISSHFSLVALGLLPQTQLSLFSLNKDVIKLVILSEMYRDTAAKDHSFLEEAALIKYFSFISRLLTTSYTTIDRSGLPVAPVGFDSAKFLAALKGLAVETIEPLWKDSQLSHCPSLLVSSLLQLVKHLLKPEAPEAPAAPAARQANPSAALHQHLVDPNTVAALVEMGFEEHRIIQAINTIQSNSIEAATEWLFMNMGSAQDEESEMARALALSLQQDAPAAAQVSAEASEASSSSAPAVDEKEKRIKDLIEELRSTLLDKCLLFANASDNQAGFAIVDALSLLCGDEKGCKQVVESIDKALSCSPAEPSVSRQSLAHVLAVLVTEDAECRNAARACACLKHLCDLLQDTTLPESGPVPSWVCPCLLVMNILLQPADVASKPQTSSLQRYVSLSIDFLQAEV